MNTNKIIHSSYEFHSITNLYNGSSETDLNLEIYEYGTDSVEMRLINKNYEKLYKTLRTNFIYLNLCVTVYAMLVISKTVHLLNIDIVLILWTMLLLWRANCLTKSENLIFSYDFGIHLQVQKYWGKHNRFIAASNIYDIVANEVLEDFDFRYLLLVRTKGELFNKKPIICVFQIFKPSLECISLIYKHLNKVLVKNNFAERKGL